LFVDSPVRQIERIRNRRHRLKTDEILARRCIDDGHGILRPVDYQMRLPFPSTQKVDRPSEPRTRLLKTSSSFVVASETGSVKFTGLRSPVGTNSGESSKCSRAATCTLH